MNFLVAENIVEAIVTLRYIQASMFVEIDHEIISTASLLPSNDSSRVVGSYKRKCVHEVLVNCLVKLTQRKNVVR